MFLWYEIICVPIGYRISYVDPFACNYGEIRTVFEA